MLKNYATKRTILWGVTVVVYPVHVPVKILLTLQYRREVIKEFIITDFTYFTRIRVALKIERNLIDANQIIWRSPHIGVNGHKVILRNTVTQTDNTIRYRIISVQIEFFGINHYRNGIRIDQFINS